MADYTTFLRTNYFHVVDDDDYLNFMSRVVVEGGEIEMLLNIDDEGLPLYGFSSHGLIVGVTDDVSEADDCGDAYGSFLAGLQELVAEGDAIIMIEVGSSDKGNALATATIITSDDTDYVDLQETATKRAMEILTQSGGD